MRPACTGRAHFAIARACEACACHRVRMCVIVWACVRACAGSALICPIWLAAVASGTHGPRGYAELREDAQFIATACSTAASLAGNMRMQEVRANAAILRVQLGRAQYDACTTLGPTGSFAKSIWRNHAGCDAMVRAGHAVRRTVAQAHHSLAISHGQLLRPLSPAGRPG